MKVQLSMRDAVAQRLVRWTTDSATCIQALAWVTALCPWTRHSTLVVLKPLYLCLRVWAICWGNITMLATNLRGLESHPGGGSRITPGCCMF